MLDWCVLISVIEHDGDTIDSRAQPEVSAGRHSFRGVTTGLRSQQPDGQIESYYRKWVAAAEAVQYATVLRPKRNCIYYKARRLSKLTQERTRTHANIKTYGRVALRDC